MKKLSSYIEKKINQNGSIDTFMVEKKNKTLISQNINGIEMKCNYSPIEGVYILRSGNPLGKKEDVFSYICPCCGANKFIRNIPHILKRNNDEGGVILVCKQCGFSDTESNITAMLEMTSALLDDLLKEQYNKKGV